ncbi:hypothetical protein evm_006963 [Chilo suppressalis]|nr:hypothetical protein evm_006963 [Chilo suppressalis]
MSKLEPNEAKSKEVTDAVRRSFKSCVPQRLPVGRQKQPQWKPGVAPNTKSPVVPSTQPRFAAKPVTRPRSGEQQQSRPRSANKMKDDKAPPNSPHSVMRSSCPEREKYLSAKKSSVIPKRIMHETKPTRMLYTNRAARLPNQDIINKHEDLELQQSETKAGDPNDTDSISSRNEKLTQLKITWQEKILEFEKVKNELSEKQRVIMALYAGLGKTHQKMSALGHKTSLPSPDELQIINVTNMTPEQLLQLCACPEQNDFATRAPISIEKLYIMPSKLIGTCEQTLFKNKEIIDLLDSSLSSSEKNKSFLRKLKEYAAENEMLSYSLDKVKKEFIVELNEIVAFLRKSEQERMTLNLRNEQLICEVSELNSYKNDLRKQLHEADCRRSSGIKNRVEELEKLLKEEKCKNNIIKNQLNRATCQAKNNEVQISHMEAALEQSQSKGWALERTVLDLQEKNQKLQDEYSSEFNKFTESITQNTAHLEEIAKAREKLQTEKEDLERRLIDLSSYYDESVNNMKEEINTKVEKIIESEMKYEQEKEERVKLVNKVESLCAQLLESELRFKDMCKQVHEKELQLSNALKCQQEFEITKQQLDIANTEIEKYRGRFLEQSEAIKEIERNLKESVTLEEDLKRDLKIKEEYIEELEKKVDLLEQQRQDSESKMNFYEEQLSSLKNLLGQLQKDFGEFESLNELHEMVTKQRANLIEANRQNGELAEVLQKKDKDIEHYLETISQQERIIEQRDDIVKMLSQKEEEHTNIIKLLRNNLEMRTQAEDDLNQQVSQKNVEIDSLITNLDRKKTQICELENIIFTIENQTRKASAQNRKDQEKIESLESKLAEYDNFFIKNKRSMETPAENLDSIIKILEQELINPIEEPIVNNESIYFNQKHEVNNKIINKNSHKYQMGLLTNNEVYEKRCFKKVYDDLKCEGDRQKCSKNIQTKNWIPSPKPKTNIHQSMTIDTKESWNRKDNDFTRNLQLPVQQLHGDKKTKTFKFAAHRL